MGVEISKEWGGIPFRLPEQQAEVSDLTVMFSVGGAAVLALCFILYGIGYLNGDRGRRGDYDRGYEHGRERGRQEGKEEGAENVRSGRWI